MILVNFFLGRIVIKFFNFLFILIYFSMGELNIIYKRNYELLLGDYYFLKCLKLLLVIFFLCMYCLCFLLNYLVNISEN